MIDNKTPQDKDNFYSKVYDIVKQIPIGKVTSYGAIAEAIGLRSSARMVGWALNAAKEQTDIPFHRVVNRNGDLTGQRFFATPTLMRELLESEGVSFIGDAVDMSKHLWKPLEEMGKFK